jgi:ATP synthase protein I
MTADPRAENGAGGDGEADEIARKARRKARARRAEAGNVWYGLGMFGLVGWAVAVPTLAGLALGLWLDARGGGPGGGGPTWTLSGLLGGAALGCLNAWYWVRREGQDD